MDPRSTTGVIMITIQTRLGSTLYDGIAEIPDFQLEVPPQPTPTITENAIPEEAYRQDEESA